MSLTIFAQQWTDWSWTIVVTGRRAILDPVATPTGEGSSLKQDGRQGQDSERYGTLHFLFFHEMLLHYINTKCTNKDNKKKYSNGL